MTATRAKDALFRFAIRGFNFATRKLIWTPLLVIPVVQQLGVDELRGWQKSLAIVGMKSNCLVLSAIKYPLLGRGKR